MVIKKGAYQWNHHKYRFTKMELRIGNVDESSKNGVQLTENTVVGFYDQPNEDLFWNCVLASPISGRYLTLQRVDNKRHVYDIEDINVYYWYLKKEKITCFTVLSIHSIFFQWEPFHLSSPWYNSFKSSHSTSILITFFRILLNTWNCKIKGKSSN